MSKEKNTRIHRGTQTELKRFQLEVPLKMYRQLQDEAKSDHRSLTNLVTVILQRYIDEKNDGTA